MLGMKTLDLRKSWGLHPCTYASAALLLYVAPVASASCDVVPSLDYIAVVALHRHEWSSYALP